MTKVQKLENEVQQLNPDELAAFREWFRKYDSDEWDKEIERDVSAGRLDKLAEEAVAAHKIKLEKRVSPGIHEFPYLSLVAYT